jgi:hypothetical protein
VTQAALTAGLNNSGGRTVKVLGICDRDRSVHAGRSRLYFTRLGTVGHREGDFDTGTHMSRIFLDVRFGLLRF